MGRYCLFGHPVAHSHSPWIHARFAQLTGQDIRYELHDVATREAFFAAVADFRAEGGLGCNVTVPYKFDAPMLAQGVTEQDRLCGAYNTLRFDADGIRGTNTDGDGLVHDLTRNAGRPLSGARVLLAGAGGAAAGVLGPLIRSGCAVVDLTNRTPERAQALAARHAALAQAHGTALGVLVPGSIGAAYDIVINATASSLAGGAPPVPATALRAGSLACDLMYGPAAQGFLRWAEGLGAVPRDGLGMLVEQAALAFRFWRQVEPPAAQVLAELRERLAAA